MMPMQYQTRIGDLGSSMSSGQKQGVFIARAFYRGPDILLFDEATSHLDILKEAQVAQEISRKELTRVLVAHHPHSVASEDRTLIMEHGQVTQLDQHAGVGV